MNDAGGSAPSREAICKAGRSPERHHGVLPTDRDQDRPDGAPDRSQRQTGGCQRQSCKGSKKSGPISLVARERSATGSGQRRLENASHGLQPASTALEKLAGLAAREISQTDLRRGDCRNASAARQGQSHWRHERSRTANHRSCQQRADAAKQAAGIMHMPKPTPKRQKLLPRWSGCGHHPKLVDAGTAGKPSTLAQKRGGKHAEAEAAQTLGG